MGKQRSIGSKVISYTIERIFQIAIWTYDLCVQNGVLVRGSANYTERRCNLPEMIDINKPASESAAVPVGNNCPISKRIDETS